jgi:hypothetical protein
VASWAVPARIDAAKEALCREERPLSLMAKPNTREKGNTPRRIGSTEVPPCKKACLFVRVFGAEEGAFLLQDMVSFVPFNVLWSPSIVRHKAGILYFKSIFSTIFQNSFLA